MYSIHIDEPATRVSCCTAITSSVYIFSEKLNNLLDHLGNRRMMRDYQSDTLN
jgi:hypothetical protein